MKREDRLAVTTKTRGFSLKDAAQYLGIGCSTFGKLVAEKQLPAPMRFGRRRVWDRCVLDRFIDNLNGLEQHPASETNAMLRAIDD